MLPSLKELHLRSVQASEPGLSALANAIEPRNGGLPALRNLFMDEPSLKHAGHKGACSARGIRLDFF